MGLLHCETRLKSSAQTFGVSGVLNRDFYPKKKQTSSMAPKRAQVSNSSDTISLTPWVPHTWTVTKTEVGFSVCKCLNVGVEGMKDRQIVHLGQTSASLTTCNAVTSSLFPTPTTSRKLSFKLQRCWNACMSLYFPAPSSTQDVISSAKWNRTDSFCRRNMTDTSPDEDLFSTLWKFLTKVGKSSENLFTIQMPGLCCCC